MSAKGPKICMIAAAAENGVIGRDNKLPWKIKSEWQYFLDTSKGKPVIEGRLTFEAHGGKPFTHSPDIVITRNKNYAAKGAILVHTLEEAIDRARGIAAETGADEIMIGGGAEIYRLGLPLAARLYLTEIHANPEGDAHFPAFDRAGWTETKSEFHKAQAGESA
ncbi:MAG: dihydrofolate reductase, partial [Alphaproteobacteria bacterium]|nr:dihydrofolate reductase [Alphaproteobacteria bacterium]